MASEEKKIVPKLQFSVLCDAIAPPNNNNKPVFIGIFSSLLKPIVVPQFFIANRWIGGQGEFTEKVKILTPQLKLLLETNADKVSLPTKVDSADVYHGFINVNFPTHGVYWIVIELDGEKVLSYPLPVFE